MVRSSFSAFTFAGTPHRVTIPGNVIRTYELVGSAEQSFIQMIFDGTLPPGRYQTVTPCFRSDAQDELHESHFIKLELIDTANSSSWPDIASIAQDFFSIPTSIVGISDKQCDIVSADIELGSYGCRRMFKDVFFAYGTGVAEPRYSLAKKKFQEKQVEYA